jgi:outer membrane biosynthesis protein TonB
VYVVHNRIAPGGDTGWHSHAGPSIISVRAGRATEYHGDDPVGTVHAAGTAFVDDGRHAHLIRNEGKDDLELVAFQILPRGAERRVDQPQPQPKPKPKPQPQPQPQEAKVDPEPPEPKPEQAP